VSFISQRSRQRSPSNCRKKLQRIHSISFRPSTLICDEKTRTCAGVEEKLHDGDAVVPGGVVHRRVSLVVDVVDRRQGAVDVRLHDVQQTVTRCLSTTAGTP